MAPWEPRLMLMSGSLGRRAATLPKWRCCVRWGRREAAMAAFAKNWRHPSACIAIGEAPGAANRPLTGEAEVERRWLRARRYAFHPDEVAEAEAQGLPYALVPRVCSSGREWMERWSGMQGSPPPIQVINDRTGRGVSDRGSGTPRAEVTRLGRPTRGHAVQQAPSPFPRRAPQPD
jgi:hypothetical protein